MPSNRLTNSRAASLGAAAALVSAAAPAASVACRFELQVNCAEIGCAAAQPPLAGEIMVDLEAERAEN